MAVIEQKVTDRYAIYNADCMQVLPSVRDASVGFSVYSPPFPELYQYSNDPRDMSNCVNYEEGIAQYRFIVEQIARVTMPGRLSAVHCANLKNGNKLRDFPGDIVRVHEQCGFHFHGRVTIWKDPWLVARRTRLRSLMHKSMVNDSGGVSTAGADYALVFKRAGENQHPIVHPDGLKEYAGEEQIPEDLIAGFSDYTGDQRKNLLSHWIWRRYASEVWMDIRSGRLLPYREAKEVDEEKHVCALQLDVIDRLLTLWSNPGDAVLTPFMGVGSEVYAALKMGRRAIGIELKETYYRQAVKNILTVDDPQPLAQNALFDQESDADALMDIEIEEAAE